MAWRQLAQPRFLLYEDSLWVSCQIWMWWLITYALFREGKWLQKAATAQSLQSEVRQFTENRLQKQAPISPSDFFLSERCLESEARQLPSKPWTKPRNH